MKEKQYLFSNFKAFLIFTVVFGHCVQNLPDSVIKSFLMLYIYAFHMPAFIFVSGYFSKNVEKSFHTAFEKYFIPFIYMSVIYIIVNLMISRSIYVRFIVPVFAAWYVLVVFYYKILIKYLSKYSMKIVMPLSIIVSLLIGMVPFIGSEFCLERLFSFLPFYLAGFYLSHDRLNIIKKKIPTFVAVIGLVLIAVIDFIYVLLQPFNYQPFLCNVSYHALGFLWWQGVLFKCLFTILALVFIFLFLIVFKEKQYRFSYIGDNTMSVYALHCIPFLLIRKTGFLTQMNPLAGAALSLLMAVVIVLVLSIPKVNQIYMAGIQICTKLEKKYILCVADE